MTARARLLASGGLLGTLALGLGPGCEVDDRVLHGEAERGGHEARGGAASGGGGGASSGGRAGASGGSAGARPDSGAGGSDVAAGSGGMGPDSGTGCPDLDRNMVPDCEETLIQNPAFNLGTDGWNSDMDASIAWDAMDAQSQPDSGSLVVKNVQKGDTDTLGMVGASDCIAVTPGERYSLYAETFVQADAPGGYAGATVWFYDQPNCSGALIEAAQSPLQGALMTWKVIRLRPILVPDFSASMLIRLAAAKMLMAEPLTVRFDNVLLSR